MVSLRRDLRENGICLLIHPSDEVHQTLSLGILGHDSASSLDQVSDLAGSGIFQCNVKVSDGITASLDLSCGSRHKGSTLPKEGGGSSTSLRGVLSHIFILGVLECHIHFVRMIFNSIRSMLL